MSSRRFPRVEYQQLLLTLSRLGHTMRTITNTTRPLLQAQAYSLVLNEKKSSIHRQK